MSIQQDLIKFVESQSDIGGRFVNMSCVTFDAGKREGVMSIVFKAKDKITGDTVALKFIDPVFVASGDINRQQYFNREFDLMEFVRPNTRSANLSGDKDTLPFPIAVRGGGTGYSLAVTYFPVEWLDGDIDRIVFDQENIDPAEKLEILRAVSLAVRSIHKIEIAHRDIKRDNIRVANPGTARSRLKLIDFGMAIHLNSTRAHALYGGAIGADAFSPPESFLGFEGVRNLACKRDMYSLGALVYSVFNSAEFWTERRRSTDFFKILSSQYSTFMSCTNDDARNQLWDDMIARSKYRLAPPDICGPYSSVPTSIRTLIERVYSSLCRFDFNERPNSLDKTIDDIDSAIKVLANAKADAVARARRKTIRENKLAKLAAKKARLNATRMVSDYA